MKKGLALILALVLTLSLCACGAITTTTTTTAQTDPSANSTKEPVVETETSVNKELSFDSLNDLGEVGEITFLSAFSCEKLEPPMSSGVHLTYSPSDGNVYVVLSAKLTNLTSSSCSVDNLVELKIAAAGSEKTFLASSYAVINDGSKLDSYPSIDPLATQEIYFAFAVPAGTENENYVLALKAKDETMYTGTFSVAQFESKRPELKVGDTISDDTIELTIGEVKFDSSLYPPKKSGYYHYYEAESGKTYLIVKVTATNLKGNDMKYDSIAGVSCVYKEKYHYSSFCVLEEDGGADLDGYPSQNSIAPLDKGTCYYLMEVPEIVKEGPVEITVYAAGQYYTLKI